MFKFSFKSLIIFIIAVLKSLSANFISSYISESVSIDCFSPGYESDFPVLLHMYCNVLLDAQFVDVTLLSVWILLSSFKGVEFGFHRS